MNKTIIKLWENKKEELKQYISENNQEEYASYLKLVKVITQIVLNSGYEDEWGSECTFNHEAIHKIDDGDYQGTLIFIIPMDIYQPSEDQYLITNVSYGSCSGCDTLESIHSYDTGKPSPEQVEGYMTLCLHLIQKMKYLGDIW